MESLRLKLYLFYRKHPNFKRVLVIILLVTLFVAVLPDYDRPTIDLWTTQLQNADENLNNDITSPNISSEMMSIIDRQRNENKKRLNGITLHSDSNKNRNGDFSEFIPEKGGLPLNTIVVSKFRSGSSFVGSCLSSIPVSFYYFEPMMNSPKPENEQINVIRNLLNCKFLKSDGYLDKMNDKLCFIRRNSHVRDKCKNRYHDCMTPEFMTPFCKLFPFFVMKTVRLLLKLFEELLEDKSLKVKIIYLVRDPRGVINSRKAVKRQLPKMKTKQLCSDLISDYNYAVRFRQRFPTTFKVIRYEDVSLQPYERFKELLYFMGFNMHRNVIKYLDTHTNTSDIRGVKPSSHFDTRRNSSMTPFHWQRDLKFEEVDKIQNLCQPAMNSWGYAMAHNQSHQESFTPYLPAEDFEIFR